MPTDQKSIDAYNKFAERWASAKRDGSSIFHIYLEKPAMYGKLPDVKELTILCIGCGSGEEVEFLHSLGAKRVVGIDISEGLIDIAKKTYPDLEFHVMDMEHLDFPPETFDLAFSSLTMHYIDDWSASLQSIHKVLKKDGIFLFSITHPFFSAMQKSEDDKEKVRLLGYKALKEHDTVEIFGNYLDGYQLEAFLMNKSFTVTNYHKPLSVITKTVVSAGFEIMDIVEPKALDASKEEHKNFWEIHQKIPEFMVMELRKK